MPRLPLSPKVDIDFFFFLFFFVFSEEQCNVGRDDVGGVAVSVRHDDADDGTGDQEIRGTRDHRDAIDITIRQAEEGPTRTHLIMNSRRLATFQDHQAGPERGAKTGDAMDVDASTGSSSVRSCSSWDQW